MVRTLRVRQLEIDSRARRDFRKILLGRDGELHRHRRHVFLDRAMRNQNRALRRIDCQNQSFDPITMRASCQEETGRRGHYDSVSANVHGSVSHLVRGMRDNRSTQMRGFWAIFLIPVLTPGADLTVRPALVFSQPFGGHNADTGTSVAVDSSGNAYVTGTTTSIDFPVKNGFQQQLLTTPLHSSLDQGKTWLTPPIPAPVYSVAASPKAPTVIYAGTSQGMYKSTDAGSTWKALSLDPTLLVEALVCDPANPSIVYAGTSGGTMKSTDAGTTWRLVDSGSDVFILVSNPLRPSNSVRRCFGE